MATQSKGFRIHWFAEGLSPYHDFFFTALSNDSDINLRVHYRIGIPDLYYWRMGKDKTYSWSVLRGRVFANIRATLLPFFDADAFYFVTGIKGITKSLLILILSLLRRKYAFWTDTPPHNYLSSVKGKVRLSLFVLIFKRARAICTTGTAGRAFFLAQGVPNNKIVDLPFFWNLDLPELSVAQQVECHRWLEDIITASDFIFILSAKLVDNKRFDLAIDCARTVLERARTKQIKWLVAGDGPEYRSLVERISAHKLEDNFHLLGWVDGYKLQYLYQIGHVFVHTAQFDPFPNVVLQAMVHGKPVIGFEGAGSVLDRVHDGSNGFVIPSGDLDTLVQRMLFCVEHPKEAEEMGRRARTTAEQWPIKKGISIVKDLVLGQLPQLNQRGTDRV